MAKLTDSLGDGLVLLRVTSQLKMKRRAGTRDARTTVSIDSVLFEGLRRQVGGQEQAEAWVQQAFATIEHAIESGQIGRPPVDVDAGASRLVQRAVARFLLGMESETLAA